MGRLRLNCDLGENESLEQTKALLRYVDAANISCGVHAGSPEKTRQTIALAKELGVLVGAHPGISAAGGRGSQLPDVGEFRTLLQQQLGSFFAAAKQCDVTVHHVKLHGSLYMAVEADRALAEAYIEELAELQVAKVFSLSGGAFAERAAQRGIACCAELFADRGYLPSGALVPRSEPGALIESVDEAVGRMRGWKESGRIPTVSGELISLNGDTLCVHSDSAGSLELLAALREL